MRDHSTRRCVSSEEAVRLLIGRSNFTQRTEAVPLALSVGRVAATDVFARYDMPPKLTCRMDSIGLRWEDIRHGPVDTSGWVRGVQWQFANTGVAMPDGFDTAIAVEHATVSTDEQHVELDEFPTERFAGTTPAGSRMKAGELLLSAGTPITSDLASHVASGGYVEVEVVAKPRVTFIPTGNELIACDRDPRDGKNFETNSVLIGTKIAAWGGQPIIRPIVRDDRDAITEAIVDAARNSDIVVINAGSSKGSDDWNIEMLEQVGEVLYHQTNHAPSRHSSGAVVEGTPVVGISGPPRGAGFTSDFYLWPLIRHYLGQPTQMQRLRVRLAAGFGEGGPGRKLAKPGQSFFLIRMLAVRQAADGMLEAMPFGMPDAHDQPKVNAYYALEMTNEKRPEAGDVVEVMLKPGCTLL